MKLLLKLLAITTLFIVIFNFVIHNNTKDKYDLIPTIQVNGVLYYDTGCVNRTKTRNDEIDGIITSEVESSQLPTKDNQSNFDTNLKYQYGAMEGTIEVYIDVHDHWLIFATNEVKETNDFTGDMNIPFELK